MKHFGRWFIGLLVAACMAGGATPGMAQQVVDLDKFKALQPEQIRTADSDISVTLIGDPDKPGIYVVQITFGPGKGSRPHFHDQDRYITVIKGTWWVSLGPDSDTYDPNKMIPMKPGSLVFHPAFGHHYDGAKDEEVVVRIMGMGPVSTTRIDQPSKR